jgi:hypothetical protein
VEGNSFASARRSQLLPGRIADAEVRVVEYILPAILGGAILYALTSLLLSLFRVMARWNNNNRQPIQARRARMVSKDQQVCLEGGNKGIWRGKSVYCATFELADTRERLTFSVRPALYVDLGEARTAILTNQGTRLLGFAEETDEHMETIAKFFTSTEANNACEVLKPRGIAAAVWPDEAPPGMWQGNVRHHIGYRLEVDAARAAEARACLRQLGFVVLEDDDTT